MSKANVCEQLSIECALMCVYVWKRDTGERINSTQWGRTLKANVYDRMEPTCALLYVLDASQEPGTETNRAFKTHQVEVNSFFPYRHLTFNRCEDAVNSLDFII